MLAGNDGNLEDFLALQEDMVFSLDPLDAPEVDVDPMWSSDASNAMDWFLTDE